MQSISSHLRSIGLFSSLAFLKGIPISGKLPDRDKLAFSSSTRILNLSIEGRRYSKTFHIHSLFVLRWIRTTHSGWISSPSGPAKEDFQSHARCQPEHLDLTLRHFPPLFLPDRFSKTEEKQATSAKAVALAHPFSCFIFIRFSEDGLSN